jgi:hypothetical protein
MSSRAGSRPSPTSTLASPPSLALLSFRYRPAGVDDEAALDALNAELLSESTMTAASI